MRRLLLTKSTRRDGRWGVSSPERELQSLAKGFGNLEEQGVKRAYAIFNNCYQNFGIMNATTMAAILRVQKQ